MITIACVLRSGGDYYPEYVSRLQAGVSAHLRLPHRFVCLSDIDVECDRIRLRHDWPGWWSKIELFDVAGPVLYFDLDTVIQGPIDALARHVLMTRGVTLLRDLGAPERLASGVLGLNHGRAHHVFEAFRADPARWQRECQSRRYWGDGGYIELATNDIPRHIWQDVTPGGTFASRKLSSPAARRAAAVVCFHGRPRPHDVAWSVL